jgi:hypothetical protein
MTGPVIFVAIILILFVVVVFGMTPLFIIPIVAIALALLFWAPLWAVVRQSRVAQPKPGPDVPSDRQASYDPVQQPRG